MVDGLAVAADEIELLPELLCCGLYGVGVDLAQSPVETRYVGNDMALASIEASNCCPKLFWIVEACSADETDARIAVRASA